MSILLAGQAPSSFDVFIHFPILLVIVNLVFSASRYDDWGQIISHALKGMLYIVTFLGGVFVFLYVVLHLLVPKFVG
jgi:hypothetical protein